MPTVAELAGQAPDYNYAFLDEHTKRELRRALLKAVAIPGYQVPFGSRELPIARGWGTGGLQVTLALVGPGDVVKVIDQGADASVNALNIRRLIERTTGLPTTTKTEEATIIQTRHRIPEQPLQSHQIAVFQVPLPEPLRAVEVSEARTREMHADQDYARMWVGLYEDIVRKGMITHSSGYPARAGGHYLFNPSPIPRWDLPKLHRARNLSLFGAGREKRVYAVPPYTDVEPIDFEDHPFTVEDMRGRVCARCGARGVFMDEVLAEHSLPVFFCSDTAYCDAMLEARERGDRDAIDRLQSFAR